VSVYKKGVERVGHLQGFTYMPKFTHRESLTPEPLLTTPNQKWMYVAFGLWNHISLNKCIVAVLHHNTTSDVTV